jgi:hypothetical protein
VTRPILIAAALALAATSAAAQLDAPSKTQGFGVGVQLHGTSVDTDQDDDFDPFTGGGLGLELAYGFSSGLALFLDVQFGGLESDDADDGAIDSGAHVDLGARMNFGAGRRSLVPFLEAAFTGVALEGETPEGDDILYGGAGVTIGGGVQYFVRRNLSLNAGLRVTGGALSSVEVDGDDQDIDDQFISTSRLIVGATWHP